MTRRRGRRRRWVDWLSAMTVGFLLAALARLPERLSYALAGRAGILFWYGSSWRARIALANLAQALGPGADAARIRRIARKSFQSLMKVALDFARLPRVLRRDTLLERVDTTQLDERLAELAEAGEGELVFVSGHLGGIEVGGAVLAYRRRMVNVIARRVENPYLDAMARRGRQSRGLRIHPRRGGIKPLVKAVESGEDAALLIDQNQRKRGLFLPFFGRLASTDRSAAVLAMRRGVPRPVLVGFAIRQGPAFRFTMEFAPVIRPTQRELAERDLAGLTRRITAAMEEIILRHPEQYLWLHDRYKTRPPGEREEGGGSPG